MEKYIPIRINLPRLKFFIKIMISQADLPNGFWVGAVNPTCFIQNKILVHKTHNKTPYELWKGKEASSELLSYLW